MRRPRARSRPLRQATETIPRRRGLLGRRARLDQQLLRLQAAHRGRVRRVQDSVCASREAPRLFAPILGERDFRKPDQARRHLFVVAAALLAQHADSEAELGFRVLQRACIEIGAAKPGMGERVPLGRLVKLLEKGYGFLRDLDRVRVLAQSSPGADCLEQGRHLFSAPFAVAGIADNLERPPEGFQGAFGIAASLAYYAETMMDAGDLPVVWPDEPQIGRERLLRERVSIVVAAAHHRDLAEVVDCRSIDGLGPAAGSLQGRYHPRQPLLRLVIGQALDCDPRELDLRLERDLGMELPPRRKAAPDAMGEVAGAIEPPQSERDLRLLGAGSRRRRRSRLAKRLEAVGGAGEEPVRPLVLALRQHRASEPQVQIGEAPGVLRRVLDLQAARLGQQRFGRRRLAAAPKKLGQCHPQRDDLAGRPIALARRRRLVECRRDTVRTLHFCLRLRDSPRRVMRPAQHECHLDGAPAGDMVAKRKDDLDRPVRIAAADGEIGKMQRGVQKELDRPEAFLRGHSVAERRGEPSGRGMSAIGCVPRRAIVACSIERTGKEMLDPHRRPVHDDRAPQRSQDFYGPLRHTLLDRGTRALERRLELLGSDPYEGLADTACAARERQPCHQKRAA